MTIGKVYGTVLTAVWSGLIDIAGDTIKCSLHDATYTPNQDTDDFFDLLAGTEIAGTGYTAGGVTLTGKTLTYNAGTNTLVIDCADPTWAAVTLSGVRYAVFRKDTGTAATSPLIAYMDFETDQSVTASNLTVVIPTTGFVQNSAA